MQTNKMQKIFRKKISLNASKLIHFQSVLMRCKVALKLHKIRLEYFTQKVYFDMFYDILEC
jgi:hypothetical protein